MADWTKQNLTKANWTKQSLSKAEWTVQGLTKADWTIQTEIILPFTYKDGDCQERMVKPYDK